MTNSEGKYVGLTGYGLEIVERVPLPVERDAPAAPATSAPAAGSPRTGKR